MPNPNIELRRKNNLEKYRVIHPMQLESVKAKRNITCIKKYGSKTVLESLEIREKIKETCLKTYGFEFFSQSDKGREIIKQTREQEKHFDGEYYDIEKVKDFCKTIDLKYLKSGGYRTLIKEDKPMYFSILKYSSELDNCENLSFRGRVYFLQGKINEYKCPICGKSYKWNNYEFVFKMSKKDVHYCYDRSLEWYQKIFGIERGKEKYEQYIKSRKSGNNSFSKVSQKFFNELVEICNLDKSKCYFATNNEEKQFILSEEYSKEIGKMYIRPDFVVGNKIIEFNGTYWHKNTQEIDFKKKCFYESQGYEVLTIWENEDWDSALKRAKEFINSGRFLIQTQSGFSPFDGIRKLFVPKIIKIFFNNTSIEVSENHKFIIFGKEVLAKTLKVGDSLLEKQTDVYDVLETNDHSYITNGVISHNCDFIGSSYTLVSADSLKRFTPKDPLQVIANRLKVFEEPQKGHKYIMGVDPAKFGADSFAIQILDVSTFPFIQVASARLPNENFQIMPEFIYDWGEYYNEAFLIIENNDGAGTYINTVLHTDYEYENLFFEKTFDTYKNHSKTKIEPGFRTNVRKSTKQMTDSTMT